MECCTINKTKKICTKTMHSILRIYSLWFTFMALLAKENTQKRKQVYNIRLTSATLSRSGSNHLSLHSQWLSRKVNTGPIAASAPLTLDLINPCLLTFLIILTFLIKAISKPSVAEMEKNRIILQQILINHLEGHKFIEQVFD